MPDSRLNGAERPLQALFSLGKRISLIFLFFLALTLTGDQDRDQPNRTPGPSVSVPVRFIPVTVKGGSFPGARLWRVEASEPRFGGLSGLALAGSRLLAVTDSGTVISLPRPGSSSAKAWFLDLPDGPGSPYWKKHRDAESLTRDPEGRGWWVGFEFHHSLYLYDPTFSRAVRRVAFADERWRPNSSLEALLPVGQGLLAVPEGGGELLRLEDGKLATRPLEHADGAPADAVRLPDGRMLMLLRTVRPWGIRNHLAELRRDREGRYRLQTLGRLPLGAFDNAEGIAAEPRQDGSIRLWIVTDNDFSEYRATMLMTVDLPRLARQDKR